MIRKPTVGRAEVQVLRFITDHPGCTVTEVGDFLAETKGQTRNTALTMMERLRAKGFLERAKVEGVYRYSPCSSKKRIVDDLIQDFVDSMLGGSISPLVAFLSRRGEMSDDQITELRQLIDTLEDEPNA
jgi:predicted transcriptional regulator